MSPGYSHSMGTETKLEGKLRMGNTTIEQMNTCNKEVMLVFILYLFNKLLSWKAMCQIRFGIPTFTSDERATIYKNSFTFFLLGSHSRLKASNLRNADYDFLI